MSIQRITEKLCNDYRKKKKVYETKNTKYQAIDGNYIKNAQRNFTLSTGSTQDLYD